MEMLTITNLQKRFGAKPVLQGVDLSVPEHSIFGFVGKNGAGKTTTMKAVLGLLRPDAGTILVSGEQVVYGQTNTNRYIGYLPDVPEFYGDMTPFEYLTLCGEVCGMKQSEIRERSRELLDQVGLGAETHRIKGFSRGMKQRLGIAQALFHRPKLLICDEPTSALDPVGRKEILEILLAVREQSTVLFSTHILSDVERICTDVAFLHDGKIAKQGTVGELKTMGVSKEFILETVTPEGAVKLVQEFGRYLSRNGQPRQAEGLCPVQDQQKSGQSHKTELRFTGEEELLFRVLQYVAEHKIPVQKIEWAEPSLESLFLEVANT
ncbi:MAG: ABC transporter ATP-binding protein [Lachnospiraceae bacterium]|nr:ABC transporter ATP-binding protein [Lachnospiraceae bacterium]